MRYFPDSDACWLGGPGAAQVAAARLVGTTGTPVPDALAADHADAAVRLGVGAGAAVVALELDPDDDLGPEGFRLTRTPQGVAVAAASERGLVYGYHRLLTTGLDTAPLGEHRPSAPIRMLDDWDNLSAAEHLGSVERGFSGPSILFADGAMVADLSRLRDYGRLMASLGLNALCLNNVNVHDAGTHLIADMLPDVARAAAVLRDYGVTTYLAANFAAPITLGDLTTADPLDPGVRAWWAEACARVYAAVPDFGGFVVKADSEGRPGPFTYGRTHADGANMLAAALAPFGGTVFWRCFVYDCRQDWRDRSTDRARAAADHFQPLDGAFADNVVLQVKYGPIDFQAREAISPLLTTLRDTNVVIELQVTQEYTGQQKHVCYLGELWAEVLGFRIGRDVDGGPSLGALVAGPAGARTGFAAVSNVGAGEFWTGHPFAQANLYAYGRLAWDPGLDPADILREWIAATYDLDAEASADLEAILLGSWATYEAYSAPLGVGFMVEPGHHYGPNVDGYEYSLWGTYHFADRDGIGVDRTVATGSGMTGLYTPEVAARYETLEACPDEYLLFFHHVPYGHVLHSGRTVIQHIYDSHFAGVEAVEAMRGRWAALRGALPARVVAEVDARLDEQLRCAVEWRDQINTYFFRKSGVPDAHGRLIHA